MAQDVIGIDLGTDVPEFPAHLQSDRGAAMLGRYLVKPTWADQ
jgi:hypothetical protein